MKLQYVFGNPTRPKKRSKKVAKKKRKNPRKSKAMGFNLVKMKNGEVKLKKTTTISTGKYPTTAEISKTRAAMNLAKAALQQARINKKKVSGKIAKAKIQKAIVNLEKAYKAVDKKLKDKVALRASEHTAFQGAIKNLKDTGAQVKTSTEYTGGSVAKKKKKKKKTTKKKTTRKKRKTKKKATKKKATKKRKTKKKSTRKKATRKKATKKKSTRKKAKKKTTKKRKTKRKSTRKKASKKKSSGRRKRKVKVSKSKAIKKGYVLKANPKKKRRSRRKKNPYFGGVIMKKNNPMSVAGMKVAGLFAKIPGLGGMAGMLGGTVPSLMAGIALNIISDKVNNKQVKQAAEFVGDGLLGAAVVGLGVHLSQTILPPALSGVDYIPGGGQGADYGGVDYTPEMSGMGAVDFVPGGSLPGHNMNADFGQYEESVADFGEIPEGMS
jgi:hypothetical protein